MSHLYLESRFFVAQDWPNGTRKMLLKSGANWRRMNMVGLRELESPTSSVSR